MGPVYEETLFFISYSEKGWEGKIGEKDSL